MRITFQLSKIHKENKMAEQTLKDKRLQLEAELGRLTLEIAEDQQELQKKQVRANEIGNALRELRK